MKSINFSKRDHHRSKRCKRKKREVLTWNRSRFVTSFPVYLKALLKGKSYSIVIMRWGNNSLPKLCLFIAHIKMFINFCFSFIFFAIRFYRVVELFYDGWKIIFDDLMNNFMKIKLLTIFSEQISVFFFFKLFVFRH